MSELREQLLAYLGEQLPGASDLQIENLRRMPEGWSRECFSFVLHWTEGGERRSQELILRRDPAGSLVYTEREVEAAVLRALHAAGLPVPKVWCLSTDGEPLGAPFMIMERVRGTSSPGVLYAEENRENRKKIGVQFVEYLARLHTVDWTGMDLPFAADPPTTETAADRVLDHWERTMAEQRLEPQPFLTQALRWLRANKPEAPRVSLLHGDYRTGNFLFEGDRITGIVDWELAALGDPLEDLGWAFKELWKHEGRICGFFDREEFLARYEEASGIPVDREAMRYWEMFAEFKHTVIGLTGIRTSCDRLTDEINFALTHLYLPPLQHEQAKVMGI